MINSKATIKTTSYTPQNEHANSKQKHLKLKMYLSMKIVILRLLEGNQVRGIYKTMTETDSTFFGAQNCDRA